MGIVLTASNPGPSACVRGSSWSVESKLQHVHDPGMNTRDQCVGRAQVANAEGDVRQHGTALTSYLDLLQCHMACTNRRCGRSCPRSPTSCAHRPDTSTAPPRFANTGGSRTSDSRTLAPSAARPGTLPRTKRYPGTMPATAGRCPDSPLQQRDETPSAPTPLNATPLKQIRSTSVRPRRDGRESSSAPSPDGTFAGSARKPSRCQQSTSP